MDNKTSIRRKTKKKAPIKAKQKEKIFNEIVDYIRENKISVAKATEIYKVNYTTFLTWTKEQSGLREELRRIKVEETKNKYERAVQYILDEKITLTEASKKAEVNKDVLSTYISKNKSTEERKIIKNILNCAKSKVYDEKIRNTNKKMSDKEVLIEMIKTADKHKNIDSLKMLELLIENDIETPRIAYTRVLEKKGYKVI